MFTKIAKEQLNETQYIRFEKGIITPECSIFLDIVRFLSALSVFVVHSITEWYPDTFDSGSPLLLLSHFAVIIFFILSGYVIAHSTNKRISNLVTFAEARFSRLFSMVIPALLVTGICEYIVKNLDTTLYLAHTRGASIIRYLLTSVLMNESWFLSAAPKFNGPLWSLSYEFWYYIIFGVWFFKKKTKGGKILTLIACTIAGPKVLLLFPIWVFGYFAYLLPYPLLPRNKAYLLVALLFLSALTSAVVFPAFSKPIGRPMLFLSNQFVRDWIVGIFAALAFWIYPKTTCRHIKTEIVQLFRKLGDLTFPIYVFHYPLLLLCAACFGYGPNRIKQLVLSVTMVLLASLFIGINLNTQRKLWVKIFNRIIVLFRLT